MKTMSVIFLVHTIGFLLLLQLTLHLADPRGSTESSVSLGPSASSSGAWEERHGSHNNNNNNNNNSRAGMRQMDSHHLTLSRMTATVKPTGSFWHGHRHGGSASSASSFPSSSSSSLPSFLPPPSHTNRRGLEQRPQQQQKIEKVSPEPSNNEEGPLEPMYLASSSRIIGPYFETNRTTVTLTARAGQTVLLDCSVALLQGRTVSWFRRMKDNLMLLTFGNATYSSDSRVGLHFRYPSNWRLGILNVNKRDEGEYHCQLSTHPPKALVYRLRVIAPEVLIIAENGNSITERHYKVDSSLHLTCKASNLDKLLNSIGWFKGDLALPGGDDRVKVKSMKNSTNGEAISFLSILSVRKTDSGNYTCRASPFASNTISVHVLNEHVNALERNDYGTSFAGTLTAIKPFTAIIVGLMTRVLLF